MDPFARELLESGRSAHEPTPEDRARVRAKIAARIGTAVVVGGGAAKLVGSSWSAIVKSSIPFILLFAAAGGYLLTHRGMDGRGSVVDEPGAMEVPASVEPVPVVPAEPAPIPAPIEAPAPAAPSPATSARATRPQASTTAPDLEAEVSLLAAAQSAIARGDYATALATLDEHRREFPRGALSEERTAARAVALCGAGRQIDGKALASSFLTRHPSSPLAPRVRSSCGVP